jgi:hypothetical protein
MTNADKQYVRDRANHCCEYCRLSQLVASYVRFQIEHIRAKQHHGTDELDNLALACPRCNRFKGTNLTAIDPETQEITQIFHPRQHVWSDHFALIGIEIIGLTSIGRCTVELLHMNDEERLRVREAMLE